MDVVKKLIHKIKCLIKKLLGKECCEKECGKKDGPKLEVVKQKDENETKAESESKNEEAHGEDEPERSKPRKAKIQSFLWKPVSDSDGNVVILVGCDSLRSEDLKCEILNSSGNKIRVSIENVGRHNKLPTQKFGRVHFRVGRRAKKLENASPLTVHLYHTIGGKKVILDSVKIKNPSKRIDKN